MSDFQEAVAASSDPEQVQQLITELAKMGTILPDNTNASNIIDRLLTAALAIQGVGGDSFSDSAEDDDDDEKIETAGAVTMNQFFNQLKALNKSQQEPPATPTKLSFNPLERVDGWDDFLEELWQSETYRGGKRV